MRKKKVLVAMSGGVDSSAAAALLVQQGYDCDGAMLKLAPNEDSRCCSADDAEDARQAATRLGMRFYVFNETDRFRRCVMDRFTAEYAAGRTPNPCIDCNRELKFGALLDRALTLRYDYIATGHYARVAYDAESGRYRLLRGVERRKDQSYVLYQLTQHQLAHLLLNSREDQGTTATIALPMVRALGTLGENIEDYTGGFQRVLLELADALPDEAFLAKHLDE